MDDQPLPMFRPAPYVPPSLTEDDLAKLRVARAELTERIDGPHQIRPREPAWAAVLRAELKAMREKIDALELQVAAQGQRIDAAAKVVGGVLRKLKPPVPTNGTHKERR